MRRGFRDQGGFTLTELVVALAVVGVMAGAFAVTRAAIESARVSRAIDEMEIIAAGAQQYAAQNGGSFNGISWGNITNLGLVPSDLMYPSWSTPWSGYYSVWAECNGACFGLGSYYYVPCSSANRLNNSLWRKGTAWVSGYGRGYCHFEVRYDR